MTEVATGPGWELRLGDYAAEGAPRGRFVSRELDAALRHHRPSAPGSACRILRALRAEGLDVRCVDPVAGVYALGPGFLG